MTKVTKICLCGCGQTVHRTDEKNGYKCLVIWEHELYDITCLQKLEDFTNIKLERSY